MPKLYNQSNASDQIVGYAFKQYNFLNGIRKMHNLGIMKKAIPLHSNLFIYLIASDQGSIFISGGIPNMLFAGENTSAYNYDRDTLSAATVKWTDNLFPMFNSRIQRNDIDFTQYLSGWVNGDLEGGGGTPLGTVPKFELGFFSSGNNIYARHDNSIYQFGSISSQETLVPEFCSAYGSLFNATYRRQDQPWNQLATDIVYAINPINKHKIDSYYWTPNLFSVAPADPYEMFGGFYYGKYPGSQYGFESNEYGWFQLPLTSAEIHFKGFLDTRFPSGTYQYGYAELVVEVQYGENSVENPNDLYIFAQSSPLSTASNSYFYNESVFGSRSAAHMTIGWEGKGSEWASKISLPASYSYPEIDLWNFASWQNTDSVLIQDPDKIGVIISSGNQAMLKRSGSYTTDVYETTEYHSHTRSQDGSLVAIFEGTDFIERIKLFDLFGTRDPEKAGEYLSGGYTEIITSEVVASVEAMVGVFIPFRTKTKTELETIQNGIDILSTAQIDTSDLGNYMDEVMPSMAILSYRKDGRSALGIKKVKIQDGVAIYQSGIDECFESKILVDDPTSTDIRTKLVSEWNVKGGILGLVRGDFTGEGDQRRFNGIGSGIVTTLPSTFSMSVDEDSLYHNVVFDGVLGELSIGSCLEETENGIVLSKSCRENLRCGEEIIATASSSCGQTGRLSYDIDIDVDELEVHGEDEPSVGNIYSPVGGVTPFSWSFDGGTIDENGEITAITSCGGSSGNGAVGSVTVTDACGQSASIEVRLPGGFWVYKGITHYCGIASGEFSCWEESIIGAVKIETRWGTITGSTPPCSTYEGCPDYAQYSSPPCSETITSCHWKSRDVRYEWECP